MLNKIDFYVDFIENVPFRNRTAQSNMGERTACATSSRVADLVSVKRTIVISYGVNEVFSLRKSLSSSIRLKFQ